MGDRNSSPSISAKMIAPPEKAFFTTYGPSYDGANFPHESDRAMFLFFRIRSPDGNQSGPSLKDPLQVSDGPITRSRAKKIKEVMQGLMQSTWDEASKSPTIKVGLKEGEPILIHLIQAVEDMT